MRHQWFAEAQNFLLVYDVTSRKSFNDMLQFHEEIIQLHGYKCRLALVATKTDIKQRRVISPWEGLAKAQKFGCCYFEVSAKDLTAVRKPFHYFIRLSRPRYQFQVEGPTASVPTDVMRTSYFEWIEIVRRGLIWVWRWLRDSIRPNGRGYATSA